MGSPDAYDAWETWQGKNGCPGFCVQVSASSFRSCVGVAFSDGHIDFTLGTRVHCKNLFGRFYMAAIDRTHRSYVTPTMMQLAAEYALLRSKDCAPVENGFGAAVTSGV